jgi:hypothetical protein
MNYTLEDIVKAIKNGDKDKISEASLGRVYQHMTKQGSESFAIITAFRGGFTYKQNLSRNKQLESSVRSLGLGFFKQKGYWNECEDPNIEYKDCPADKIKPVIELSLFIPNIQFNDAVKLGKKFDQDAIVYQGPDTDDKVELISKSGSSIMKLGKFAPNKVSQAYSKVKGRNYVFEGFEYVPSGQMSNLVFKSLLESE